MRRTHLPLGLAAATISLAFFAGCTNGGGDQTDESPSTPAKGQSEASDGKDVALSEKGITATTDSADDPMVSYAVIVENPSQDVAANLQIDIRIEDGDGDPVTDTVTDKDVNTTLLQFVAPGEKQAVTGRTYVEDEDAESIEVKLGAPKWYPADDERFQEITVSDLRTEVDDGDLELDFVVTSPYKKELQTVETYAVFRDESGEIIGGSSTTDVSNHQYSSGDNDTKIKISAGLPSDIDDSSIDIYVNPAIEGLN